MAGFKGQGACKSTLAALLNTAATAYWALFTAAPTEAGGGTEVTAADYARLAVVLNTTNFPAAVSPSVGSTGAASMANAVLQTISSGTTNNWGTVVGVALVTILTGALGVSNIIYYAPLSASRNILTGDPVEIPIGGFIATEA
jgi:hypothetical protein